MTLSAPLFDIPSAPLGESRPKILHMEMYEYIIRLYTLLSQ